MTYETNAGDGHPDFEEPSLLDELERVLGKLRSLGVSVEGSYRLEHPFDAPPTSVGTRQGRSLTSLNPQPAVQQK